MKQDAIICDLDGTLCNIDHRRHLLNGDGKNWVEFFDRMVEDTVNDWCLTLVKAMHNSGFRILFVTGRPNNYARETGDWLQEHLPSIPDYHLFMRIEGDYRPDSAVKAEIFDRRIKPGFNVHFVIDDRKQVVEMWRRNGLVCLQCAEGNY